MDDESEMIYLSSIMERANISSNDRYYEKLMRKVECYKLNEKKKKSLFYFKYSFRPTAQKWPFTALGKTRRKIVPT